MRVKKKARLLLEDLLARQHATRSANYQTACHARKQRMAQLNQRGTNYMVIPGSGKTYGQFAIPQIGEIYAKKGIPQLLTFEPDKK